MEEKVKKPGLARIPAWALSLLTFVTPIVLGFILIEFHLIDHSAIEIGFFIFCYIFIIAACFFICRTHPKSVWYTPIICNAVSILVVIFDSSVLIPPEGIYLISNVALSVTGAIVGARIGQHKIDQAN